jgi:hypothetical protein
MANVERALRYAAAGMAVFPCNADKMPLVGKDEAWLAAATTNDQRIRALWREHPDAVIGLPLKPLDLFVVDCDRHKVNEDGVEYLRQLIDKHGPLPDHPWCTTGNKGEHHYFRQPAAGGKVWGHKIGKTGLETRGFRTDNDGNYVIASGSELPDGRQWWRGIGSPSLIESYEAKLIPQAPAWLLDIVRPPEAPTTARPQQAFNGPSRNFSGDEEARIRDALRFIDADDRDLWLRIGMALKDHMGDAGRTLWDGWSQHSDKYNERDQDKTWKSLRRSGITIGTLFHHAMEAGWQEPRLQESRQANDDNQASSGKEHTAEEDAGADNTPRSDTLKSARASSFELTAIQWLWPNRFALGKLAILGGLPDQGKGQILADMAARVTRGDEWPCEEGRAPQGNVILLTAEDDPNDTVVPRLIAAGADLDRIEIVQMVGNGDKDRMFSLMTDLALLGEKITEVGNVKLIQIDPMSAYLGVGKIDSYRTTDVRAVLAPVVNLAAEQKVAIVGIMHFNKKTDVTNAMLRISDSLAYVATARHCYVVVDDAENQRKLLVKAKNNLAPDGKSLAYTFGLREVGKDRQTGQTIHAPHVLWWPEHVDVTATEAMEAAASATAQSPGARDTAKQFLSDMLRAGPKLKRDIEEAAEANMISERTLRRAKDELHVVARKEGMNGPWLWELPKQNKRWHDDD